MKKKTKEYDQTSPLIKESLKFSKPMNATY